MKLHQPTKLGENETQQKLDHWKAQFILYYSRDDSFQLFLDPETRWDHGRPNYGFQQETDGLERTPAKLKMELLAFFQLVSSYMPAYYITSKLKFTGCIDDVWKLVYRLYGAEITCDTLLNVMSMRKPPQENYRCFMERITGHVVDHLVGPDVMVDEYASGPLGDRMNISSLNLVTVLWLHLINPKLPKIIQTEYQKELRDGAQIYGLVDRISLNIDVLLAKHDGDSGVHRVSEVPVAPRSVVSTPSATPPGLANSAPYEHERSTMDHLADFTGADSYVRFLRRGRGGSPGMSRSPFARSRGSSNRRGGSRSNFQRGQAFCGHCAFIKRQSGKFLDVNHDPDTCPRKNSAIRLLQAAEDASSMITEPNDYEDDADTYYEAEEGYEDGAGMSSKLMTHSANRTIQTIETGGEDPGKHPAPHLYRAFLSKLKKTQQASRHDPSPSCISRVSNKNVYKNLKALIFSLTSPSVTQKAKSPSLLVVCRGHEFLVILDTGAELNVADCSLMKKLGFKIVPSPIQANAANDSALDVQGRTDQEVVLECQMQQGLVHIMLGKVTVVQNLGVPFIIGEPGLRDNFLSTVPYLEMIFMRNGDRTSSVPYSSAKMSKKTFQVARATSRTILHPGDLLTVETPTMVASTKVSVHPRRDTAQWLTPHTANNPAGVFQLRNDSQEVVVIKKRAPVAEIRAMWLRDPSCPDPQLRVGSVTIPEPPAHPVDPVQYNPILDFKDDHDSFIKQIKIDEKAPLSRQDRKDFEKIHQRFKTVFTPRPGRYNGACGRVSNDIAFVSLPAPNAKIHVPQYSPEMTEELAKKMDQLRDYGVLMEPDRLGIRVKFCSPSMIIPKADKKEFRLVTDFSMLNTYIRKSPAISPSIREAQRAMAKARFRIDLDLSNYFYQSGMSRGDMEYLGTHHPFRGMMVYTCQPQGLKNASEDGYEKLARIFGQEIRAGRMTRMADGLHVLADTISDLKRNYVRVLQLIQKCGLTLKPSKVEICPTSSEIFGWQLTEGFWSPTAHTCSALAEYKQPKTINQLRSFVGAFKQLSQCVPRYAEILHSLDTYIGGKPSREEIVWSPEMVERFTKAREAAKDPQAFTYPRPTDVLHTFSDYSAAGRAIGGRLMIERKNTLGSSTYHLGGYFSVIVDKFKERWTPCEGEALGIKMVLEHFAPLIRESRNQAIHHSDSKVCVQAWRRLHRGAFSTSSRVASFLSGLSTLGVEVQHMPGKELMTSDFTSRNPPRCTNPDSCQVCKFAENIQKVGDRASYVRKLSAEEVLLGRQSMPFTTRKTWVSVQSQDPMHCQLRELIRTGQSPISKKTRGDHTRLKHLHTMYTKGQVTLHDDGLVTVECKDKDGFFSGQAVSVPHSMFMGVLQSIHIRMDHPSKSQMAALVQKFFYTVGWNALIGELVDNCHQCAAMKTLPGILSADRPSATEGFGKSFSADIIERCGQKLLVVRENLSSFTSISLLADQTANTIRPALLGSLLDLIPASGCRVRTDGAASFQSLAAEASVKDSLLFKYGISIEIGDPLNSNRNPVAENAIKEFHKEVLKIHGDNRKLTELEVQEVQRVMNSRPRESGHAAKEIVLRRDLQDNLIKIVDDEQIRKLKTDRRTDMVESHVIHDAKSKKIPEEEHFTKGDIVFLRSAGNKLQAKESYIIVEIKGEVITVKKVQHQFRAKSYQVRAKDITLSPISKQIKQGRDNQSLLSEVDSSEDSDDEFEPEEPKQKKVTFAQPTAAKKRRVRRKALETRKAKEAEHPGKNSHGQQSGEIPTVRRRGRPRKVPTAEDRENTSHGGPSWEKFPRRSRPEKNSQDETPWENPRTKSPRRKAAITAQSRSTWRVSNITRKPQECSTSSSETSDDEMFEMNGWVEYQLIGQSDQKQAADHNIPQQLPAQPPLHDQGSDSEYNTASEAEEEDLDGYETTREPENDREERQEDLQRVLVVDEQLSEAESLQDKEKTPLFEAGHSSDNSQDLRWDYSPEQFDSQHFGFFSDQNQTMVEIQEADTELDKILSEQVILFPDTQSNSDLDSVPAPLRKPKVRLQAISHAGLSRKPAFRQNQKTFRKWRRTRNPTASEPNSNQIFESVFTTTDSSEDEQTKSSSPLVDRKEIGSGLIRRTQSDPACEPPELPEEISRFNYLSRSDPLVNGTEFCDGLRKFLNDQTWLNGPEESENEMPVMNESENERANYQPPQLDPALTAVGSARPQIPGLSLLSSSQLPDTEQDPAILAVYSSPHQQPQQGNILRSVLNLDQTFPVPKDLNKPGLFNESLDKLHRHEVNSRKSERLSSKARVNYRSFNSEGRKFSQ